MKFWKINKIKSMKKQKIILDNIIDNLAIAWWNKTAWNTRKVLTEKYIFRCVSYENNQLFSPLWADDIEKIYKLEHVKQNN